MNQFYYQINERVARASASLRGARAAGDDYLVDVHTGELEELARMAASHDVNVPGLHELLATTTGQLPVIQPSQVIDLRDRSRAYSG